MWTVPKYDIVAFNETNLRFEKVANGSLKFKPEKLPNDLSDLLLQDFHGSILQNPVSSKGGGLAWAIYVNKRVVELEAQIEPFSTDFSGEFQFIKIHKCKGFQQT